MLKIVKTSPQNLHNSFDKKAIEKYWSKKCKNNITGQLFFDSKIYCGKFKDENTLEFFDFSYKEYNFTRNHNIDIYAFGGLFIVRTSDNKILVIQRASTVSHFPEHFSLPGGFLSPNGSELTDYNSLLHLTSLELKEELNINVEENLVPQKFEYMGHIKDKKSYADRLYFYIEFDLTSKELEKLIKLEPTEVKEYFFISPQEFLELCKDKSMKLSPVLSKLFKNSKKLGLDKYFSNDILYK